jgi:hypothetical protein
LGRGRGEEKGEKRGQKLDQMMEPQKEDELVKGSERRSEWEQGSGMERLDWLSGREKERGLARRRSGRVWE